MRGFASPQTSLGDLDAKSAGALISVISDVTLAMDAAGNIQDLAFQNEELVRDLDGAEGWIGRPLAATVMPDSRPKVEALLRDAASSTDTRWRHINHQARDGRSVPVLYCCVQLGGHGRLVAFGRDLRAMSALQQRLVNAQQSMERDYSRLRDIELRYRLLFQLSSEAVLIVDSVRLRVTEANPAARALFGVEVGNLAGLGLANLFDAESVGSVESHLAAVRAGVSAGDGRASTLRGGHKVTLTASVFRQDGDVLFLVRVVAADAAGTANAVPDLKHKLLKAVESAPDGFVVTDDTGRILTTNAAFLEMVGLAGEDQVRGQPLDRWLGATGLDTEVLIANLRQRGLVRFFTSTLRAEDEAGVDGAGVAVEISAVSVGNGGQPSFGFAIRNVGPRLHLEPAPAGAAALPRSVEQLKELIGRVPLKDLVREATEMIERLCIEAALELTGDNRASAADMLGLSRQSLYVKLRRYGMGDLSSDLPSGEEG